MSNVIPFPREFRKRLDEQMETIFGKPATPTRVLAFERLTDALKAHYQQYQQIKDRNEPPESAA